LSVSETPLKVGHSVSQRSLGFFCENRFRCYAQTEFMMLKAGFEIGNQKVKQIFFRLVKHAEVGAPWLIADALDTYWSKCAVHFRTLRQLV
jgi:hypothetical protein